MKILSWNTIPVDIVLKASGWLDCVQEKRKLKIASCARSLTTEITPLETLYEVLLDLDSRPVLAVPLDSEVDAALQGHETDFLTICFETDL